MFLILDQGGGSSRALLIDRTGAVLARAQRPVTTSHPRPGWVEQRPDEVVASLHDCAAAVIAQCGVESIEAAGLVTQRASLCCWRRGGAALSPILSWQDRRNAGWLARHPLPPALAAPTGLRPSPHLGASKYRWCLDHLQPVREAAARGDLAFGPLAAFLLQRLCPGAAFAVDPANASRTLLFDLREGGWSEPLLGHFGVRSGWLPRIVPTLHEFGELALGEHRLPLRLLNGDQSAAAFAYGEAPAGVVQANLGTGAFVFALQARVPAEAAPLQTGIAVAGEGARYTLEGTVHGAGAALAWWSQRRGADYRPLLAQVLSPGVRPALFLNAVGGLGSPDWRGDVESRFEENGGDVAAELAGVLESILFLIERNLALLRARLPVAALWLSGGLAQLDGLCQRLADLTGLPVRRFAEGEASALGAAWLLAGRPREWAPAREWREFAPRLNPALAARQRRWVAMLERSLDRGEG